jgi:hypothetical protein
VADQPAPIVLLATAWLAAEREATNVGNTGNSKTNARSASAAYVAAVTAASREDLLVAWQAARDIQAATEMGSAAWADARRVAELLRHEYLAASET